ncbi:PAS domain-containing protein [Bacillaceae bacterium SIJ1]|uniref:two-component system sensor histidine kinase NtrB n=1 Tax=Litoribacterium kuwaitense TaxID=1398745 RepID=UPI0013E9FC6B|nr:ATP-binding protein [Litoribacterium kuwaitense]NGP43540.1 PAS domain-containing protein [Litoribacterium kuwaitense]
MQSYDRVDDKVNAFEGLTSEIRLVLDTNGEIISINSYGRRIFEKETFSFFDYFEEDVRHKAFQFLQNVTLSEQELKVSLPIVKKQQKKKLVCKGKKGKGGIYIVAFLASNEKSAEGEQIFSLLKNQEQRGQLLHFLTEQLDLAIILFSDKDTIEFSNKRFEEMFLVEEEGMIGQTLFDLNDDHPMKETLKSIVKDTRINKKVSERYYYEDEALFQFQGIYFEDDQAVLLIIHDRSYQQRFENLLVYKQQMESVSQLAAGVAHELRNPLSVIRGFLQLSSLTNDWNKYYNTILSELTRMNDIIEDFLSVSRKKINKQKVQPHTIFKSLIYIIRSECLLHNITFEYHIEETEAYVNVNEAMIKQVLLNLLRNTIEVYEEKSKNRRFVLYTRVANGDYYITVQDFGKGMSPEVLEQLGKPFFTTKEKGNGIGIPLCKKIVESHEGEFHVESELGVGTKITFSLPLIHHSP